MQWKGILKNLWISGENRQYMYSRYLMNSRQVHNGSAKRDCYTFGHDIENEMKGEYKKKLTTSGRIYTTMWVKTLKINEILRRILESVGQNSKTILNVRNLEVANKKALATN